MSNQSEGQLVGTEKRFGRYVMERLLGEGGMGKVYRAHDPVLGRHVAVKAVSFDTFVDEETRREYTVRFTTEARASAKLNHPSIVTVYDAGEEDGTPWIAFELVDGEGLDQVIAGEGRLALEWAVAVASDIASALELYRFAAHLCGFHRGCTHNSPGAHLGKQTRTGIAVVGAWCRTAFVQGQHLLRDPRTRSFIVRHWRRMLGAGLITFFAVTAMTARVRTLRRQTIEAPTTKALAAAEALRRYPFVDGYDRILTRAEWYIAKGICERGIELIAHELDAANSRSVQKWLRNPHYWLRWNAARIRRAADLPVDSVKVYTLDLAHAGSVRTRARAARKLAEIGDSRAIPALKAARDKGMRDPVVTAAASAALEELGAND